MRKEEIIKEISSLEKELNKIIKQEQDIKFLSLLLDVLRNDPCTITLTGHGEWQFQEKYNMRDITFEHRNAVAKEINKIIKELKENI